VATLGITAVVVTHSPRKELALVLDELEGAPVDEVIVVENGLNPELAGREDRVRVLRPGDNIGVEARNLAAREAKGEPLLMLDDDAYPLPGAVEELAEAFRRDPKLGVAGGLVRDVDLATGVEVERGVNTFDFWLSGGRKPSEQDLGLPAFFFPEGASMVRREAFLQVGGYYEPYFQTVSELDLATRMLASGWEVRYLPSARFVHLKASTGRDKAEMLELRIRNQIWYFYRHFPATVAARRIPAYLLFDLIESAKSGAVGSWARGVAGAWRERSLVQGTRRPLTRSLVRRAELNRGRLHLRLLADRARRYARPRKT
jgi:GT2 family glycosyltransferase